VSLFSFFLASRKGLHGLNRFGSFSKKKFLKLSVSGCCAMQVGMDRSSSSPSPRWFEGQTDQQPSVRGRAGPSAVNVISITRRPEGGIVNVEVRRQEGSGADQSGGSFGSRESSPHNVVFAKTPPLPIDTRFRGFGGLSLHGTDTGRLHRALADHVRALHGQSLFDRFNEPAPPTFDSHLSHSSSSLSSGRRIHTIPIRIAGRRRPASCPPPTSPQQRVYEIPVNVLSSPSKEKPVTGQSDQPEKFDSAAWLRFPSQLDTSNDTEKKLASLMSQLETEMNSGTSAASPVRKQMSEISLTPVAVSTTKSPPPYHGPHTTEFLGRPAHLVEGAMPAKPSAGFVSVAEPGSPLPVQSPGFTGAGTPVRTVPVAMEPPSHVAGSVQHYGTYLSVCLLVISNVNVVKLFHKIVVLMFVHISFTRYSTIKQLPTWTPWLS